MYYVLTYVIHLCIYLCIYLLGLLKHNLTNQNTMMSDSIPASEQLIAILSFSLGCHMKDLNFRLALQLKLLGT